MKRRGEQNPKNVQIRVADQEWMIPVVRGLSFENEREGEAYLLADNALTILGGFDEKLLAEILPEHQMNVAGLGFTQEELQKYIPQFRVVEMEPQREPKAENTENGLVCPKCGYEFTGEETSKWLKAKTEKGS